MSLILICNSALQIALVSVTTDFFTNFETATQNRLCPTPMAMHHA